MLHFLVRLELFLKLYEGASLPKVLKKDVPELIGAFVGLVWILAVCFSFVVFGLNSGNKVVGILLVLTGPSAGICLAILYAKLRSEWLRRHLYRYWYLSTKDEVVVEDLTLLPDERRLVLPENCKYKEAGGGLIYVAPHSRWFGKRNPYGIPLHHLDIDMNRELDGEPSEYYKDKVVIKDKLSGSKICLDTHPYLKPLERDRTLTLAMILDNLCKDYEHKIRDYKDCLTSDVTRVLERAIETIRDCKKTAGERRLLELREYLELVVFEIKSGKVKIPVSSIY